MRFLWLVGALVVAAGCTESSSTTDGAGGTGATGTTSSTTAAGGGGANATGGGGAGAGGAGGNGGPFVLEAHTSVTGDTSLALTTNLPATTAACLAAPFVGTPCGDLDLDGLADAWEGLVIDKFRPLLRFDEDESLIGDASFVVLDVARVARVSSDPLRVRLFVMIGYARDYGSCGGFTGHNGDSERIAVDLVGTNGGGPGDVTALAFYTAAHEGTANDNSMMFEGVARSDLEFPNDAVTGEPRWVVYPSADKHATYATVALCEGISFLPCVDEDCAADGVPDPLVFERLPPFVNAGEEAYPLVADLTGAGFPGDQAWAAQDFCGGLGGTSCSAPVRDKLLADPFPP